MFEFWPAAADWNMQKWAKSGQSVTQFASLERRICIYLSLAWVIRVFVFLGNF